MFEEARGRNQLTFIDDPLTRKGCQLWLNRVLAFYGDDGGVDVEVIEDEVVLNEKTAEYLYSDFTPLEIKYVPGSRPLLEKVVAQNTTDEMTDRQKAMALMVRCRDNRDMGLANASLFWGGSEEELLKRGAIMCNEISRVYVCLCQVVGIPARFHCSHITGHMMAEVHTEGKWGWVDPMKGLAAVMDDDSPASAWELRQDPTLFERQPKEFWDRCRPGPAPLDQVKPRSLAFVMAKLADCYFNPREAMAIGNYFAWDNDKYTFPWFNGPVDPQGRKDAQRQEMLNRKALGWPDYYFNQDLFEGELKTR